MLSAETALESARRRAASPRAPVLRSAGGRSRGGRHPGRGRRRSGGSRSTKRSRLWRLKWASWAVVPPSPSVAKEADPRKTGQADQPARSARTAGGTARPARAALSGARDENTTQPAGPVGRRRHQRRTRPGGTARTRTEDASPGAGRASGSRQPGGLSRIRLWRRGRGSLQPRLRMPAIPLRRTANSPAFQPRPASPSGRWSGYARRIFRRTPPWGTIPKPSGSACTPPSRARKKETQALYEWARNTAGENEAGIFDAQLLFLEDPELIALASNACCRSGFKPRGHGGRRLKPSRPACLRSGDPYLRGAGGGCGGCRGPGPAQIDRLDEWLRCNSPSPPSWQRTT